MIVVGIDPSITGTGICAIDLDAHKILHASVIRPKPRKGHWTARLRSIVEQVDDVLMPLPLDGTHCVLEELGTHINHGRHGGGGSGMAVYGAAVGAIYFACSAMLYTDTLPPTAFTGIWRTKEQRQTRVFFEFPELTTISDPGMDLSDAAAVALRWSQTEHEKALRQQ